MKERHHGGFLATMCRVYIMGSVCVCVPVVYCIVFIL